MPWLHTHGGSRRGPRLPDLSRGLAEWLWWIAGGSNADTPD